jgi:hypothetical protein
MILVTIDPGRSSGIAWWDLEARALLGARAIDPETLSFGSMKVVSLSPVTRIVWERPVFRGGRGATAPVDDLVTLAHRAGVIVGAIASRQISAPVVESITPSGWKGQTPKDVSHARIRTALTPQEIGLVPARAPGDVWDAIGIGLRLLRRA